MVLDLNESVGVQFWSTKYPWFNDLCTNCNNGWKLLSILAHMVRFHSVLAFILIGIANMERGESLQSNSKQSLLMAMVEKQTKIVERLLATVQVRDNVSTKLEFVH